jgi:hypothetical protein
MRNSAEKCYMVQYINFLSLDVSVIFTCICVDLKDLDGGSEIRIRSDILFCVFWLGIYIKLC